MTALAAVYRDAAVRRQLFVFAGIGLANTVVYFATYDLLRLAGLAPQPANLVAVAVSVASSFWMNRRFTFGLTGSDGLPRQITAFVSVFTVTLMVSGAGLELTLSALPDPGLLVEHVALVASVAAVTLLRFFLFRSWVFPSVDATGARELTHPAMLGEAT